MRRKGSETTRKISYSEILKESREYAELIESYQNRVVLQKTRTIRLLGRKNPAKIIHTLLGFEVQASYKRIQCPDMVTARYLRLFSELGCHSVKLPYDPTVTARLISKYEAAIEDINSRIRKRFPHEVPVQQQVTRRIYSLIRKQLAAARS